MPQARFTFSETTTQASGSATPSMATPPVNASRSMFGSAVPSIPGVAQVIQEGIDDTRMDLTQLEDSDTGRSVPSTLSQISPATDLPPSVRACLGIFVELIFFLRFVYNRDWN